MFIKYNVTFVSVHENFIDNNPSGFFFVFGKILKNEFSFLRLQKTILTN